jgi:TubC N-terminal docking domain
MIPDSQKLDGLLLMLRGRGVQLWVEDGELHYRGSADALTPDLVSRLRQQKLAIIEFLKKAELTKMAENHHSLFRSKHLDQLPLSYAQERLWFLDQLEPGSVQYNVPFGLRLTDRAAARGFAHTLQGGGGPAAAGH